MKVCIKCRKRKRNCHFSRNSKAKDGLYSYCKECSKNKLNKRTEQLRKGETPEGYGEKPGPKEEIHEIYNDMENVFLRAVDRYRHDKIDGKCISLTQALAVLIELGAVRPLNEWKLYQEN